MYERYDSLVGVVISVSSRGCHVEAMDSRKTRGFFFGGGRTGDVVLCSVKKANRLDSLLLSLDSVLKYANIQ